MYENEYFTFKFKCSIMKMKSNTKSCCQHIQWMMLTFIALCIISCKDDDKMSVAAFDPSKPVVISDFTPKEGGAYQKIVIYGENFGADPSLVKVNIGGKDATIISTQGTSLYCFVPSGAFSGEIKVSVGEGENVQVATASTSFVYQKKMVVGTLCGYRNNNDDQGWKDDPFETCAGFRNDGFLKFDPANPNHLYVCYDGKKEIQLIDLENRTLSSPMNNSSLPNSRLRSLDFTIDKKYMIVAVDFDGQQERSQSVYIIERNSKGTFDNDCNTQELAAYKQCNGASIHPKNGELYFNSYDKGQLYRLDLNDYFETIKSGLAWDPKVVSNDQFQLLYTVADPSWEYRIYIHPEGEYAYIVVRNQHYILRTDYDKANKRFVFPYVVAGARGKADWVDAVGTDARMNTPDQGVFVLNDEYVKEGRSDHYDFYFTEKGNHCVRLMTPEGIVKTYAGRGNSTSVTDNNFWGTEDGDLREVARFRDPTGFTYDPGTNTFYILDTVGRKIRTISMEKEETNADETNN